MNNKLKLSVFLFVCFFAINLKSQNGKKSFVSGKDVFGARVFIKNNGQFNNSTNTKEKIYYAFENGDERVYFTEKGLIYKQVKMYPITEEMRESMERGGKLKTKPDEIHFIEMNWVNANSTIVIEESEKQNHYFTYGTSEFNGSTYKKITYKNVYNGIDFEYTLPDNKEHGIKYNVIIHPGADATKIKMLYSGDVKRIKKDSDGNVVIKTELSDITEYAPVSFYQDKKNVTTTLEVNKLTLSFNFPEGYDHSQTLTIDPWITMISSISTTNYAFDVDFDYAGNTYVYGGTTPFKVSMFNPSGILQWTFGGSVITPAWSPGVYVSNFVVNKSTGKCYLGQGLGAGGNRIIRIDNLGNYDNFITPANPGWLECWDFGFHCATGDIYAFGGGVSGNLSAGIVNQITAACTPTTFFPSYTSGGQDIASHAIDDFGNPFVYYSQSLGWISALLNNKIVRLNSAFSSSVWVQPSTYTTLDEAENKNAYVGAGIMTSSLSSNGYNCLAVNSNYLFFYDGFNLAAYNKTTGVKIGFTTITGYTVMAQGGIAADDCDNVYVGGNGSVLSYSFNGTSFTANPSIPLGATSTNKFVYDIKLNKATSLLYVSGSGFVGTYSAIPCAYNAILTSSTTVCAGSNVQLTAPPSTSYTWTGPGGFTSSVQNPTISTITTAGAGAYSVVIAPSFCSTSTLAIVNVSVTPFPIPVAVNAGPYCAGDTIQLSVGTYSSHAWTGPGGFTSSLQNPFIANSSSTMSGTYFVTVSNSSCIVTASTSVIVGNTPILSVTASNGGVTGCNPNTVSLTVINSNTNVINPSYTWSSLTTTGTAISTNSYITAGAPGGINTLTVYGSDPANSACVSMATISITQNTTAPSMSVNPLTTQTLNCNGACKSFTATTTTTTNVIGTWDGPSGQIVPPTGTPMLLCANAPGTYTANFCSTITGCCASTTVAVVSNTSIPTISVNVATSNGFTINCTNPNVIMNINSSGTLAPIGYTWTPLANPTASVANTIGGYTATIPGQYEAQFHDGNFCYVTTTVNIYIDTLRPSPTSLTNLPSNSYTINCYNPTLIATAITNPLLPASSYSWTQPGPLTVPSNTTLISMGSIPGPSGSSVTYTVIAMGPNGCIGKQKVVFTKDTYTPNYVPVSTPSTGITCANSCVALSPSGTSTVPITYTFTSPAPTQTATTSGALMCVPGAYTMNYINMLNGCPGVSTVNVASNVTPPAIIPSPNVYIPCGQTTTVISAGTVTTSPTYSYSWVGPPGSAMSCLGGTACISPSVNMPGYYEVTILNTANGCLSVNSVSVDFGGLNVAFTANPNSGFAPLNVNFTNTSQLGSSGTGTVYTSWNYGNGITYTSTATSASLAASGLPNGSTIYQSAGSYTVVLYMQQVTGQPLPPGFPPNYCTGTYSLVINVELPSGLTIPNVFTPNGDGVNDYFFLQTTNLTNIHCLIYDRWGVKMYETTSEKGNIQWDGKNLNKKDVPDGTYFYIIKATGLDLKDYEYKGPLTLFR